MSYHGKIQTLLKGKADAEIQKWAAEQLEKETNAEPVAWWNSDYINPELTPNCNVWLSQKKEGTFSQPLYTTPQTKDKE